MKGRFVSGIDPPSAGLFTDLYQLTMAASYFEQEMAGEAVFSLFVRNYPKDRSYFVAAGLPDVLDFLRSLEFSGEACAFLKGTSRFTDPFLEYLRTIRFSGSVRAMAEGTLVFTDEPILEISAPIIEAQLVETFAINAIHLQTTLATKASRPVLAARGRPLVDFALRRAHGTDAGLKASRACHLAGFSATSNVLAGRRYGIPVTGTMAHSYVTSFEDELVAFRSFARTFPDDAVLLIDTYDTLSGAKKAAVVGRELAEKGHALRGVRLDSGDIAELSRGVRRILDEAGLPDVKIFASGGLDEERIERIISGGGVVDAFGVGTSVGASADAPTLDMAYKLVSYKGRPVMKLSTGKEALPGAKQVYRCRDARGAFESDTIAKSDEPGPEGAIPLLECVMREGELTGELPALESARARCAEGLAMLPERYRRIRGADQYPVKASAGLRKLLGSARKIAEGQVLES